MNPNCTTEVITSTGKFTFYSETMSVCEAKKFCGKKGEILAPITNKNDFDELYKVTQMGNHPGCPFHYGPYIYYSIGLDVTSCGGKGKQDRVFTNGVVWNNTVHGQLYTDIRDSWNRPCVHALMYNNADKPTVEPYGTFCYQHRYRFLCLKEADPSVLVASESCGSTSEAVKSDYYEHFFTAGFICSLVVSGVFFALMAIIYYKKYRAIEQKLDNVKNELKFVKN